MRRDTRLSVLSVLVGLLLPIGAARAATQGGGEAKDTAPSGPPAMNQRIVAARVDGDVIFVDEVDLALAVATRGRQVSRESVVRLKAEVLQRIIERRLIEHYLVTAGYAAEQADVDREAARMLEKLKARGQSLDSWLKNSKLTSEQLRQRLEWRLAWKVGFPRYIEEHRGEERLKQYFDQHRTELDGTRIRVRHILLRVDTPRDRAAIGRAIEKARRIRAEIVSGAIDFAAAARRDSDGPSRRDGGDLGFFPRHGVMVDAFAEAAFSLDDQEISEPVVTPFGVHLIQRIETRHGDKSFDEVRKTLKPADRKRMYDDIDRQLYAELIDRLKKKSRIEFSGKSPYLDPQTRKLVVPGKDGADAGGETNAS